MQDRIYIRIVASGLSNVNAIVIARGDAGQELGNILAVNQAQNNLNFPLNRTISESEFLQNIPAGVEDFSAISYISAGKTYQYKNSNIPLGEIRGQIGPFRMNSHYLPMRLFQKQQTRVQPSNF